MQQFTDKEYIKELEKEIANLSIEVKLQVTEIRRLKAQLRKTKDELHNRRRR